MNGKQSKRLRRLSNECSIGYRPLKQVYKKICNMDAMQEKALRHETGSKVDGKVPETDTADKEIQ
jgi:hypothetical protein